MVRSRVQDRLNPIASKKLVTSNTDYCPLSHGTKSDRWDVSEIERERCRHHFPDDDNVV